MAEVRRLFKDMSHVIVLVALIGLMLGILTWTNILPCNAVPGWCSVYWGIMGGPKVLIVYGDSGLGNPIGEKCDQEECSLQALLSNPEFVGVRADSLHISRVNLGNLKPYHLVIVERAKKIPTKTLKVFVDYYNAGGRIVWTGDAGTALGEEVVGGKVIRVQLLLGKERDSSDENVPIGLWARKEGNEMVSFDYLLSVEYSGNYCDFSGCLEDRPIHAGNLKPEPSLQHPLIKGMAAELPLWVFKGQDFSIVKTISGGITTEALTLEMGSNVIGEGGKNYGSRNPMIVSSGLGGRVVYYSMPPEYYANPKLEKFGKGTYLLPLENMYYGIVRG